MKRIALSILLFPLWLIAIVLWAVFAQLFFALVALPLYLWGLFDEKFTPPKWADDDVYRERTARWVGLIPKLRDYILKP